MLLKNDFIVQVAQALLVINKTATDEDLRTYVVEEVVDRVSLYLNYAPDTEYDERLVKIVARIVSGIFNQTKANENSSGTDTAVSSISDNGQSISYADKTKNYLASAADGELFGGIAELLKPYRRVNVVS